MHQLRGPAEAPARGSAAPAEAPAEFQVWRLADGTWTWRLVDRASGLVLAYGGAHAAARPADGRARAEAAIDLVRAAAPGAPVVELPHPPSRAA